MHYLTNYYKNLCEQLQEKINILESQLNEAGLQKALRSKDPEKLKKETEKQIMKSERAGKEYTRAGEIYRMTLDPRAAFKMEVEAEKIKAHEKNIEDLGADNYDGPDPGSDASAEEVVATQQKNQYTGKLQ